MKYIKSSRGYYYKEFSNDKRIRVSAEEYNTKKQKFKNEQEGGGQQYSAQPPQPAEPAEPPAQQLPTITTQQPQNQRSSVITQDTLENFRIHSKDLARDDNNIKKEAIEKKELEEKKRKKRLRFRQDIANELAQAIILMS